METSYLKESDKLKDLAASLAGGPQHVFAPAVFQGYLLASLADAVWPGGKLLVVTAGATQAERLRDDIDAFAYEFPVWQLPPRNVIHGSGLMPSHRSVGFRHRAISALDGESPVVIVTDVLALQELSLEPSLWTRPLMLKAGDSPGFESVIETLALLGYQRESQVEDRGQFAVRGGIIDCFPSSEEGPTRAEFLGDELESLRRFSPFTQRSLADLEKLVVYAAAGGEPEGAAGAGLLAALNKNTGLVLVDAGLFEDAVSSFQDDLADIPDGARHYLEFPDFEKGLQSAALLIEGLASDQPFSFEASGASFASRGRADASKRLRRLISEGYRVFIHCDTRGSAERAQYALGGAADLLEPGGLPPDKPGAWLLAAPSPRGFFSKDLRLAIFGEQALLKPVRPARMHPSALGGRELASLRELTPGDFVVHEDHGIGAFEAIETRAVSGVTRDYLYLRYKGGDALYVPQEQIYKVSRYIGTRESSPPLNKLGGRAWALARSRAKKAAREMAGELLQLYAARQSLPGYAFGPDDQWQMQMESAFPYKETPDQASAIENVKEDMESPHPMDRLICGDVGFGKTEVALRAAFKAAEQGKQVLMLVPTTILALQHYHTFQQRFEPYPVTVEMISRFRSQAEGRKIGRDFREGRIDVLIGTHRLLSSDIIPRDLGLVIIDEEQRFGVAQKEHLRQLRLKVDVLSLTATPIPRTLQMSLSGVRDISVMETPPAGRNPIRTFVGEFDEELVAQSIRREVQRGGQVFFMHNRVESIDDIAEQLRSLLPDVRFLVAHGQMPEKELESVMVDFLDRQADVLVCTSIIESGLDIPNANTLIIDRADMLGLAQLYQIRGRIGRSEATAHAYLFYPPFAAPTADAMARLSTLSDYTELGSGFRIAMRDLEIRGAGNLLGDEQSGHVAAVGFEMYLDLLRRAVSEIKHEPLEELHVARLDSDVDAFIPADYINLEAARIEVHHRIAAAGAKESLRQIRSELADRFGPPPEVVENLLYMQEIRLEAAALGASSVSWRRGRLELTSLVIGAGGRERLDDTGLKYAYYPLRQTLVIWPSAGEEGGVDLSVIRQLLSDIMSVLVLAKTG